MFSDPQVSTVLRIQQVADLLVVDLRGVLGDSIGERYTPRTSMYDTSTVKLTLGSAAFFSSTRVNSSEQVSGIIPLSAPSARSHPMSVRDARYNAYTHIPSY